MRIVLVNPGPRFQPVTTTTGSPAFMKPRPLPKLRPNCTLASTSFSQSSDTIPAVTNMQYNFQLNNDIFSFKEQNEGITTQKLTLPACSKWKEQAHHAVYMRPLFRSEPSWSVSTTWYECQHATNVHVLCKYDQCEGIWGWIFHPIMINHWSVPPNFILFYFLKSAKATNVTFEVLRTMLLIILVSWDVAVCCWTSGSWHHHSLTVWVREYL